MAVSKMWSGIRKRGKKLRRWVACCWGKKTFNELSADLSLRAALFGILYGGSRSSNQSQCHAVVSLGSTLCY